MKYTFAVALAAGVEAHHHVHQNHIVDMMNLQTQVAGPPVHMKGNHWRWNWPNGIVDDSTDDDTIMNWMRKPKPANPPIKYHDKMRQWQSGTWPVNFSWNAPMDKATYHNWIDDGTDDNESVDVMTAQHGI